MIKDSLSNASLYHSVHPRFKAAFEWIEQNANAALDEGKTVIDGDALFCNSQHYDTHPFNWKKFETHTKYIDIQFVVSGSENIFLGDPATMETAVKYDDAKDIRFLSGRGSPTLLSAGEFMIIWPHEAHAPGCDPSAEKSAVNKLILKLSI